MDLLAGLVWHIDRFLSVGSTTLAASRTPKQKKIKRSNDARQLRLESLEARTLMHASPVLDAEHLAVFGSMDTNGVVTGGLVPDATLEYKSIATGNWSNAAVWAHLQLDGTFKSDGTTPDNLDDVLISQNTTITVDGMENAKLNTDGVTSHRVALHSIRDDGTLQFATNANTELLVDTIIVEPTGTYLMGTETNRIGAGVTAKVVFAAGAIDTTWDPLEFSKGLVSHGDVSIYGQTVTSFVPIASGLNVKATTIDLGTLPTGWHVGDRLIISGNTADNANNINQDEQVAITKITGSVITISAPLKYAHTAGSVYVSDVTRNATFESEDVDDVMQRGHIMFMHSDNVHIDGAGFYGLGRTDKRNPIDDPVLVDDPDHPGQKTTDVIAANINTIDPSVGHRVLVPVVDAAGNPVLKADGTPLLQIAKTGLNPRGRYAVHFHRTGLDEDSPAASINDSAVVDSPGWGIVNHSSDVDVTNNVVFNALGAAYVTEAGDELGTFDHNIAIHGQGSDQGLESRKSVQDFGHEGDGFWLQGGNVSVTNNVVSGMRHSGYIFFPVGLDQKGLGVTMISGANLTEYAWADPTKMYAVGDVPLKEFKGNVAFATGDGFESWFSQLNVPVTRYTPTVVEDFSVWQTNGDGIFTPYTNDIVFKNVTAIGNLKSPHGTAFARNDVTRNVTYDHVHVEGWNVGIDVAVNGTSTINSGTFNNVQSILINTANSRSRVVNLIDTALDRMTFLDNLKDSAGKARAQTDIFLQSNFNPKEEDITRLFNPDVIQMGTVNYNGKQLYYLEQAANYVPFDTSIPGRVIDNVPLALRDKTNQQLWDTYGLAIGGVVAPATAAKSDPRINALIGPHADYLADAQLTSKKYVSGDAAYLLTYKVYDPDKQIAGKHDASGYITIKETAASTLVDGWNLLTRNVLGHARTFLVFADSIPPTFQLNSNVPLIVNQADIDNGTSFTVDGWVVDNSTGKTHFQQSFKLNDASHVSAVHSIVDATGKTINVVTLSFVITDRAGNKTTVKIDLQVSYTAILVKDVGRKALPTIAPSTTLQALIGHA